MAVSELGCAYASLLLHDDGIPITDEKIRSVLQAANVSVESYWPSLYAKLAERKNLGDLIMNSFSAGAAAPAAVAAPAAAAPEAAAEKKEEPKEEEESDEEGGIFGLFDD